MRRVLALVVAFAAAQPALASGLLIPKEVKVPPLALLNHQVDVEIEDQVAITTIEQVFRNHTDLKLEATYVFPVPKGASVREFNMWVGGVKVKGELVEAAKAKEIYQSMVSRTMDPALLEYVGSNLFKMSVFPINPKSDQKIKISYTAVATMDSGAVEYVYPMKTDSKAASTLEKFTMRVKLKSQHPITNIYSPTHAITTRRPSDKEAVVGFEKDAMALDKDFSLYYSAGGKDVGLTALTHRPNPSQNGYFMMLISPRTELSKAQQVPRDMVFVLDTSGSMRGKRMEQAKKALKYCLEQLTEKDHFAVLNFATTVNKFRDKLDVADGDNVYEAKKWVDALEPTGGTAINDALTQALAMRPNDDGRTFNIVFFTDGRPTIGETDGDKIVKNITKLNTGNTRIFTFGVGDDVNASMLDQIAEQSRSIVSYVRETETIEAKAESLFNKIANPVLANLKFSVTGDITISEVYPPQLPDLFHGNQLVVFGRYGGKGHSAIKLEGNVGKEKLEFVYEVAFADKTAEEKVFVEDLWARRKVGYLLDQIRVNGESKELVEEVVTLAKRYGITTPYTSYLVMPDGPVPTPIAKAPPVKGPDGKPVAPVDGKPDVGFHLDKPAPPPLLTPATVAPGTGGPVPTTIPVTDALKGLTGGSDSKGSGGTEKSGEAKDGLITGARGEVETKKFKEGAKGKKGGFGGEPGKSDPSAKTYDEALKAMKDLDDARRAFATGDKYTVQNGTLGVNLSVYCQNLRDQNILTRSASRVVNTRNCVEVGGVWIDDGFNPKMEMVAVKAMSKAYFRLIERQPKLKEVFQLGNHVVWVTPSGKALVIDQGHGQEDMHDADIDRLFVPVESKETKKVEKK